MMRHWGLFQAGGASRPESLPGPAASPSSAGTALCLPRSASSRPQSRAVDTQLSRQVREPGNVGTTPGGQRSRARPIFLQPVGQRPHIIFHSRQNAEPRAFMRMNLS